jgi:hypothetical protein
MSKICRTFASKGILRQTVEQNKSEFWTARGWLPVLRRVCRAATNRFRTLQSSPSAANRRTMLPFQSARFCGMLACSS